MLTAALRGRIHDSTRSSLASTVQKTSCIDGGIHTWPYEGCGALRDCRYLLHDRDTKFTRTFRAIVTSGNVEPPALRRSAKVVEALRAVGPQRADFRPWGASW